MYSNDARSEKKNKVNMLKIYSYSIIESALSQLISISLFLEGEGGWELAEQ